MKIIDSFQVFMKKKFPVHVEISRIFSTFVAAFAMVDRAHVVEAHLQVLDKIEFCYADFLATGGNVYTWKN